MHHHQPDILQNLRHELSNGRMWLDRTVVLAYAAIAGLSVVGFTFLTTLCGMHMPENKGQEFGMVYQLHNLPQSLHRYQ